MADYIFFRKSRNALSSFLHLFLNLLLGVGSILLTALTNSCIIGFLLVVLSKWRVFAVRFRYLFLNIKSNLVDLVIGFSFIILAYFAGSELSILHLILAICYSLWLIVLKPLSSETGNFIQALISIFLGTTASIIVVSTLSLDSIFIVILEFIIGYSSSRHVLAQNGNKDLTLYSAVCGLIFAEIAWLFDSWVITYNFPIFNSLLIVPQISIVLSIFAFVLYKINQSLTKHDGKIMKKELSPPIIFGAATIVILVIFFSKTAF